MGWLQGSISFRCVAENTGERGTLLLAARTWTEVGVGLWVPLPTATCGQSPSHCAGSEWVDAGCLGAETPLQVLASRTYRIPRVLPPCLLKTLIKNTHNKQPLQSQGQGGLAVIMIFETQP